MCPFLCLLPLPFPKVLSPCLQSPVGCHVSGRRPYDGVQDGGRVHELQGTVDVYHFFNHYTTTPLHHHTTHRHTHHHTTTHIATPPPHHITPYTTTPLHHTHHHTTHHYTHTTHHYTHTTSHHTTTPLRFANCLLSLRIRASRVPIQPCN